MGAVSNVELVGVKAVAGTGLVKVVVGPMGGGANPWTLCPAAYRVTVPAAAGDLLMWLPAVINDGGDAECDLASVVAGAPVRFYSGGPGAVQDANGHGGLYLGGNFGTGMWPTLRWVVDTSDIAAGTVTLAWMYKAGGSRNAGSLAYASTIDLINYGRIS
jgi:hypothetical protein